MESTPTHHDGIDDTPLHIAKLEVERVEAEARAALQSQVVNLAAIRCSDELLANVEELNLRNAGWFSEEKQPKSSKDQLPVPDELSDKIWQLWLNYAIPSVRSTLPKNRQKPKSLARGEVAIDKIFEAQEGLFYTKNKSWIEKLKEIDETI